VVPPPQTGLGVAEPTKCGFKFNREQKPVIIFQVVVKKVMNLQFTQQNTRREHKLFGSEWAKGLEKSRSFHVPNI
jgi:hypothetical protein